MRSQLYARLGNIMSELIGDRTTGCLMMIDFPHAILHSGRAFVLTDDVDIPAGDKFDIRIQTADVPELMHLTYAARCSGKMTFSIFADTSRTHEPANALVPVNRRFDSLRQSDELICHTPSGSGSSGTLKYRKRLNAGELLTTGVHGGERREFILARNTSYLIRFKAAENDDLDFELDWYEWADEQPVE